uniref:Uncharacterized protein n=1 Tax=Arundo donax TaxID=35708 RepID=A0A0A8ZSW7_ARUDO
MQSLILRGLSNKTNGHPTKYMVVDQE